MKFRELQRALIVALMLSVTAGANAQEAKPTPADLKAAGAAFDRGRVAYEEEQYIQAAENFEAADSSAPSPAALRLALAMRYEAGQLDRAATLAGLAVSRYPDDEKLVPEAQKVLQEAQESLAQFVVICDEACELAVDGKLQHAGRAISHLVFVVPGEHQVSAGWSSDRAESKSVSGVATEEKEIVFQAPAIPRAPAEKPVLQSQQQDDNTNYEPWAEEPAEVEHSGWKPVVFWTSLGVTIAGAGASTALTVFAANNPGKDAVLDNCEKGDRDCPEFQEGVKNQRNATIVWGVTGAAAAFTIVTGLWLTDWSTGNDSAFLTGHRLGSKVKSKAFTYRNGNFSVTPNFTAGQLELGQGARVFATGTF